MTRRISRRAFIGGTAGAGALAAGGATWAALLTRGDDNPPPAEPLATSTPQPTPTPVPTLAPRARGSQTIATSGSFAFDTFDAQRTGKPAVLDVLGRTHSRLMNWGAATGDGLQVEGDLASEWEQPDATTYLLTVNPEAKWHDKQPLNGRPVTAEDVVAHHRRALAIASEGKAPLSQRYQQYAGVEAVDSPQPGIVRFRTKAPDPSFYDLLAGEFALIQAPEAVEAYAGSWSKLDSDHVIGSGAWTFDWTQEGMGFTAWQHGHRRPQLETLRVVEPANAVQRFIDGQLDEAPVFDRRDGERIRTALPGGEGVGFVSVPRFSRDPVMSTFFVGAPPWNNPDLIHAIGEAIRRPIVSELFGGRAALAPGIPHALPGTGVTLTDRAAMPGALTPTEAKQLWQAAGGSGLGTVIVDFPSIFDPLYSASSVIIEALNSTLGPQFRPAVETYTAISKRVVEGYYGNGRAAFWFGWGPSLPSPDGRRYATELYGKGSPGQALTGGPGADDPLDVSELASKGYLGIVPWAQQIVEVFRTAKASGPNRQMVAFPSQHFDYQRSNG